MQYPETLKTFFETLANRSSFTKTYANPVKFNNTRIKYKELFDIFESIHFPEHLTVSEKIKWVCSDISETPTCAHCGTPTKPSGNTGHYPPYCNQTCYTNYLAINNQQSKKVKIGDNIFNSMTDACISENISNYKLKLKLYSDSELKYTYWPDHTQSLESELQELITVSDKLGDKAWLSEQKDNYVSMDDVCTQLKVSLDHLRLAYCIHNISTKFDQILKESKFKLEDKAWLEQMLTGKTSISSIATTLDCSPSTVLNYLHFHNIEIPRSLSSAGEEELAEYIRSLGFEIIQRSRSLISPLELDIFIPAVSVAFEYNGVYWHRENEQKHFKKYKECKSKGIKLIQIFEDEWIDNQVLIKKKIRHILGLSQERTIYARKCELREISTREARIFYNTTHMYGAKNCSKNYGLVYEDVVVAAMSFKTNKLERYATSAVIVGGFSKLLKYAILDNNFTTVETFADLCWSDHENNVYLKNGFKFMGISQPNYFWVVKGKRESRMKYQKHKLKNMISYDAELSERTIMEKEGHYRVFDAGHAKLEFKIV